MKYTNQDLNVGSAGLVAISNASMMSFIINSIGIGITMGGTRLTLSWLLALFLGYGFTGIYVGQALSPILPAIVGTIYFYKKGWENLKLL